MIPILLPTLLKAARATVLAPHNKSIKHLVLLCYNHPAKTARTTRQRAGEVGCDLATQCGDGLRIMPFCSYGQRRGACIRIALGVFELGCFLLRPAASCLRGEKGTSPKPGSRRLQSTG